MPKDDILSKGAVLQRDASTYAITVRLSGGVFDVTTARRIADVAEKFGIPMLKVTGDARLALIGVREEVIDEVYEALGAKAQAGTQLCQQYVKSCPGNTYCLRGQQDTLELARQLEERFYPYPRIASKIKIGVAGCFNSCSEPAIKDIGLVGLPKGWVVMLGGSGGLEPTIAEIVARDVKNEDVLDLVGKILEYFSDASERPRTRNMRLGQILRIEGQEPLLLACGLSPTGPSRAGKKGAGASKWVCSTCGKVYDPGLGDPENGIAKETPFEGLPDSWFCPGCGVGKEFFHKQA